ncbi:MAG TPA: FliI/YscN family ATPase [Rhizomicrobium sp.]|nr:FliI/YscN family ATPase [Rhizomicrobium sp.]
MNAFVRRIRAVDPVLRTGRIRKIMTTALEADGPNVSLGTLCDVEARTDAGPKSFQAEIVRVDRDSVVLSPLEDGVPTFFGAMVRAGSRADRVPAGPAFLGRAVDPLGRPCDGKGPIRDDVLVPLHGVLPTPLERTSPARILETGLRAIDGLLTLGVGQRVGIFAASGVGKTTLITQLAQQVTADVLILCLVGERGREVEAIWNGALDDARRAKSTLVAATSDQSAAMRVRAGHYALALAEYWRSEGKHVLLIVDSVTRLAMALREVGLAAGEPPTARAYTPNVFAAIPKMVERCGALRSGGAITAIMTVLSETDDIDDPVCELMKSLLDGHILLSRPLAEQAQFPAIDACRSVSRQAEWLAQSSHRGHALQVLEWESLQQSARTLVDTGLHVPGANPRLDRALERHDGIVRFLKQGRDERSDLATTLGALAGLAEGGAHAA